MDPKRESEIDRLAREFILAARDGEEEDDTLISALRVAAARCLNLNGAVASLQQDVHNFRHGAEPTDEEWALLRAERDRLRELVRELAEELESELLGRYDAANGVHPALVRKFDLEMEPVKRAMEALGDG